MAMDERINRFNDKVVEILNTSENLEDYYKKIDNLIEKEVKGTYYENLKLDIIGEYGEAAILRFIDTRELDKEIGL